MVELRTSAWKPWLLGATMASLVACVGAETENLANSEEALSRGAGTTQWWQTQRAERQAELDAYIAANREDFEWFKDAPLGNSGIPMVMFRLLPELFPEIWGTPDTQFAAVGLGADTLEPGRVLPLGLGYSGAPAIPTPVGPVKVQVVTLTCMGCHGGRVQGSDGEVHTVIGAPNTQFSGFRNAVIRTVMHPGYTAARFRAAVAAKPLGWLYNDPTMLGQEAIERAIFLGPGGAEQFLGSLRTRVLAGAQRFAATIGAYTYSAPNSPNPSRPTPGFLDALGAGLAIVVDPAVLTPAQLRAYLPPAPAEIDIMSVWRQADRPMAQWDGSIASPLHRNLAAEFGVIGDPTALNMENAVRTTRFTDALPATPYPFEVRRDAVARGQRLYDENCASCHEAGNKYLFDAAEVGTDPNRAGMWSPFTVAALGNLIQAGCTDAVACNKPDGSPFAADEVLAPTGAYMAVPLDGIWSRAPYLHNGSVPTLHALLTGERPAQFYRGNIAYDEDKVGFVYDRPAPGAALFDTTRSGLSNTGHDTTEFNGNVDWKNQPEMLADLLEYLKTL